MALSLLQKGTGGALCVYASPLPDVSPGHPDTTTAPSIPGPTRAALGPVPCIVGVNARGDETAEEILRFAEASVGRKLWWAALVGASRGCSKVRDLWAHGATALALVLGDGMHGARPPDAMQLGFATSIAALGRTGALLAILLHSYIDPGPMVTSTAEMARRATGWALLPPPGVTTVVRVEEPAGGASNDPHDWRGELVVISRGSGPGDKDAHIDVLGRLLPLAIQRYVRPLVDLAERPEVSASPPPERSPEPASVPFPGAVVPAPPASAVVAAPSSSTSAPPALKPLPQGEVTPEMAAWAKDILHDQAIPMGGEQSRTFGDRLVLARVEWHPPSAQVPRKHRGVSLYAAGRAPGAPGPAPAPALVTLLRQIDAKWPSRSRASDGIAPSAAHTRANPNSDHERLDALDVTHDPLHGPDLEALAKAFLDDDRSRYAILRGRIANPDKDGGAWRPYTGANPHTDHLHLSIDPAKRDHAEPWALEGVGTGDPAGAPGAPSAAKREPLPGRPLPPPRPLAPGEGTTPIDPSEPLGERALTVALKEQSAQATEARANSMYRRGTSRSGDPWDAASFCYAGFAALRPGESLPHPYTSSVPILAKSAAFQGKGYTPKAGDGVVFAYRGDPRDGGQGRIGRVTVPPDADGAFETIEGDGDGGGWQQRAHRLDEPEIVGFLAYPQAVDDAPKTTVGLPKEIVVEDMGSLPLEEYVARVVTGENGRSTELQSLEALAMAARTYAVWVMRHEGYGTADKPMPNSTRKQVVAGQATVLATQAAQATRGGLVLYKHQPILACHNAGAVWPRGGLTGVGGTDDSQTEKNVTYNRGLRGREVKPTRIASPGPHNRGCFSQNGADELARQGYVWPEILRWFYGEDAGFSIPEPPSRRSPPRPQAPKPTTDDGDGSALPFLLAGAAGVALAARAFHG